VQESSRTPGAPACQGRFGHHGKGVPLEVRPRQGTSTLIP
jgi:hypothetical protein